MTPQDIQSLVLRAAAGPGVAHQLLEVPPGRGQDARQLLRKLPVSFGPVRVSAARCTLGFSFAGLQAVCMPEPYLRLFRRLAPAFAEGAVRRSVHLGDSGASAPRRWQPTFRHDHAHVLVSWHGEPADVRTKVIDFAQRWTRETGAKPLEPLFGERLPPPRAESGAWLHFGYRDGLSEVCIDNEPPLADAPDRRRHAPGALLLGEVDGAGTNRFALVQAPEKVRAFFRDSSFGILRPMLQDLAAFEAAIESWRIQLAQVMTSQPSAAFVKAKLCGRWPDGRPLLPGQLEPDGALLGLDLAKDTQGEGCPFGSHVRRMRAAPDGHGNLFDRPLQRRSLPFGAAAWLQPPTDGRPRGLLGQFFCASIEDQFEHLLGQWAAASPLGFDAEDDALDPLIGPHDDPKAALVVPLQGLGPQRLQGLGNWTTTLGTVYAWHPGRVGLEALLYDRMTPEEDEEPWL